MHADTAITTRVASGAALLDDLRPGWAAECHASIRMGTDCHCVLGQLYGSYQDGVYELCEHTGRDRHRLGFAAVDWADWERYSAAWQAEVDRRNQDKATR